MARCLREMARHHAKTFEVRMQAQQKFVASMRRHAKSSVFVNGNCAPANSYYFNQHGKSTLLRPTPMAIWQAGHYPLADYAFD